MGAVFVILFSLCITASSMAKTVVAPTNRYDLSYWEAVKDHLGFYPYLCEFGYRTLADHIIDAGHREFDPKLVQPGDVVYVGVWYLEWFIEKAHDSIDHPYILITCDVGAYLPRYSHLKLVFDPKVVYWYGKNMLFTPHKKLLQLPMGQMYYLWAGGVSSAIHYLNDLVATKPHPKEHLLYLNYTERNHARRSSVADKFWNKPYCLNRNRPRSSCSFETFWEEIAKSKFVLSPLGLEVDCTRTWECFALGSIPIVEHSYLDSLYDQLPILLVHDWNEITESFLHAKYEEIQAKGFSDERAFLDYWARSVEEKKQKIRRGEWEDADFKNYNFSKEEINIFRDILSKHNKLSSKLLYRGNLTYLRAFQIAKKIPSLSYIALYDLWTKEGFAYMQKFCKKPTLLEHKRVKICHPQNWDQDERESDVCFLDLTHFRHSLFLGRHELDDFSHSLEKDLTKVYKNLVKGSLLFGNMASDSYVQEVLIRFKQQAGITIHQKENFWYCVK